MAETINFITAESAEALKLHFLSTVRMPIAPQSEKISFGRPGPATLADMETLAQEDAKVLFDRHMKPLFERYGWDIPQQVFDQASSDCAAETMACVGRMINIGVNQLFWQRYADTTKDELKRMLMPYHNEAA